MPFAGYADFDACVRDNQDKSSPEGFCAYLHHQATGTWPTEMSDIKLAEHATKHIVGLEIFSAGSHTDSQGENRVWTLGDLDGLVTAFAKRTPERVPVIMGHTTPEFNAEIAEALDIPAQLLHGQDGDNGRASLGEVLKLTRHDDKLIAELEVPEQVADLVEQGYFKDVSSEIMQDYMGYEWVLSAVALLGAERPAVKDLNGLLPSMVMAEQPSRVYQFAIPSLQITQEDLRAMEKAFESAIAGRKGSRFVRAAWLEIRNKLKTMLRSKHDEREDILATETKFAIPLAEEQTAQIAALLGLPEEYGFDDIIEAINTLSQNEEEEAEEDEEEVEAEEEEEEKDYTLKKEGANMSEQVMTAAKFAETLRKRDDRIAALERTSRLFFYKELTATLGAVPGTTDELADKLVIIEAKMGAEAATERLEEWRSLNTLTSQLGVMDGQGTARAQANIEAHPFAEKVTKLAEVKSISFEKALVQAQVKDPAGFVEYMDALDPRN